MLAVLAGVLLLGLVLTDIAFTVLEPVRRGPVSRVLARGTFSLLRRVAMATHDRALSAAGPLAVAGTLLAWVLGSALAFALVYLPFVEDLSLSPSVDFGDRGFIEALYFSGTAVTSVGFGDVVAASDVLRLVSVAQAAVGFAILSGGITYVLSLYPRVSLIRSGARSVQSAAEDPARAAALVVHGGPSFLVGLQQQLLDVDEQTERFPVLYFFHSEDRAASVHTLLRGAAVVCVQARWVVGEQAAPFARTLGRELEQTLEALAEHYADRFMPRHDPEALDRPLGEEDARRRLRALLAAAGGAADAAVLGDPDEVAAFARFAGRLETFLEHIGEQHLKPHRPLA